MTALLHTHIPVLPWRRGKVRDVYDLGDRLVIVATDRISAFDWVLPTGIPDKGRILTALTLLLARFPARAASPAQHRPGRHGSGFRRGQRRAGGPLLPGAQDTGGADRVRGARLPGRVGLEGVSAAWPGVRAAAAGGPAPGRAAARTDLHSRHQGGERPRSRTSPSSAWPRSLDLTWPAHCGDKSIDVYRKAAEHARSRGILLADTKFEWGLTPDGELHSDRRGADARQFALLARGFRTIRQQPAVVRQAVRPRLAGNDKLGQEQPAAGVARGSRGANAAEISGSAAKTDAGVATIGEREL